MRYRKTVTNPFFATPAGLELTAATDTGHNPAAAVEQCNDVAHGGLGRRPCDHAREQPPRDVGRERRHNRDRLVGIV